MDFSLMRNPADISFAKLILVEFLLAKFSSYMIFHHITTMLLFYMIIPYSYMLYKLVAIAIANTTIAIIIIKITVLHLYTGVLWHYHSNGNNNDNMGLQSFDCHFINKFPTTTNCHTGTS